MLIDETVILLRPINITERVTKHFEIRNKVVSEVRQGRNPTYFNLERKPIRSFSDVIAMLDAADNQIAILGSIQPELKHDVHVIRRTKYPTAVENGIYDYNRRLCFFDVDNLNYIQDLPDIADKQCVDKVLLFMPLAFQQASKVIRFSASTGIKKGKVGLHAFVIFDELQSESSLRQLQLGIDRYMKRRIFINRDVPLTKNKQQEIAICDPAISTYQQALYISPPVLGNGVPNPFQIHERRQFIACENSMICAADLRREIEVDDAIYSAVEQNKVSQFSTKSHTQKPKKKPNRKIFADVPANDEYSTNLDNIVYLQTQKHWKLTRKGVLKSSVLQALDAARDAAPHLSELAHQIVETLPNQIQVSDNLKCGGDVSSWSELITHAISRPWISFNNAQFANSITLDCDHDNLDLVEEIVKLGCPRPLVVVDPATGRYHATWILSDPVAITADDHLTPRKALAYARALLTDALQADKAYSGQLTRNPFALKTSLAAPIRRRSEAMHADWIVEAWESEPLVWAVAMQPEPCRLGEIIAALADDFKPSWPNRTQEIETVHAAEGRNCTIFRSISEWARRTYSAYDCDFNELLSVAESVNSSFYEQLCDKEVRGIVRSVNKWMRTKWRGRSDGINRGAMKKDGSINDDMMLDEKQQKAGVWSGNKNKKDTDKKIADAIVQLSANNIKITQIAIAKQAGITERTVRSRIGKNRKNGVYQDLPLAFLVSKNLSATSDHLESSGFLTSSVGHVDNKILEVSKIIDGIKSKVADVDHNVIAINTINDVKYSSGSNNVDVSHVSLVSNKALVAFTEDVSYRYYVSKDLSEITMIDEAYEIEDGYALTIEIIRGLVSFKPDPGMLLTDSLKFKIAMIVKNFRAASEEKIAA